MIQLRTRWVDVHQINKFGISYMISILHPSQIQIMPKNMQVQNMKKDVHHVRQIQKKKSK
jgi:hypothetical protein